MSDLISRQDAINLLKKWSDGYEYIETETKLAIKEFQHLPSARPKTGHWHITDAYPHNVYCSECYTRFAQTHWAVWEDGSLPRKFCPNCGARMENGNGND